MIEFVQVHLNATENEALGGRSIIVYKTSSLFDVLKKLKVHVQKSLNFKNTSVHVWNNTKICS